MGDPHSKNNRHRPALPSHRLFSPFAFSAVTQIHTHTYARTHARTRSSTLSLPRIYLNMILFSPYGILFSLFVFFFFSTVVLAVEIGGYCLIILDAGPDFTKRWWREAVVHAVALESSCYRLTSDEKCMYKCTKIIVCCYHDPANYYRKIVTHIYHNGEKRKRMQKKENDDACLEQD